MYNYYIKALNTTSFIELRACFMRTIGPRWVFLLFIGVSRSR